MKIISVDVETANSNISSICQIGIVVFEDGKILDSFETLVNPNTYFDVMNVSIHGVDEYDVEDAPLINDIEKIIREYFSLGLVVSYGTFDKTAFERNFGNLDYPWLDVMRVVRRTWTEFAYSGYGLNNIAKFLGISNNNHHNALNDARCAGEIFYRALNETGHSIEDISKRARQSITLNSERAMLKSKGNPEGEYYGSTLVFTGTLSIPRIEAIELANQKGFDVASGISKKTNYLVKGIQELHKFKEGSALSSKEAKALEKIKQGQDIMFLNEDDFFKMIE